MPRTVIRIEHLWKQYRLGVIGHGTLYRDLQTWWAKKRGREDPNAKIGASAGLMREQVEGDRFYALRDVSLSVEQGDTVGIIGRNGAGKSTLLKILSCVTTPSKGIVKVRGRIASLLEVGTGFHQELTGRENIFLNGAILGMSKQEIRKRLDEIVAFAEIDEFLDTPVKRYSSGMYVRLAFAVAAHLEPEILIVDEVLAVGDAEFQKKCLGKMGDVAREGRTVLFVSHNMLAVKNLCKNGYLLEYGHGSFFDDINDAIEGYLSDHQDISGVISWESPDGSPGNQQIRLKAVRIVSDGEVSPAIKVNRDIEIQVDYWNLQQGARRVVSIHLVNAMGYTVLTSANWKSASLSYDPWVERKYPVGLFRTSCVLPKYLLNTGIHSVTLYINGTSAFDNILLAKNIISFLAEDDMERINDFAGNWVGAIRPKLLWKTDQLE